MKHCFYPTRTPGLQGEATKSFLNLGKTPELSMDGLVEFVGITRFSNHFTHTLKL